jgi:hypothetical protein
MAFINYITGYKSKKNLYFSKRISCSASQNTENQISIPGKIKLTDSEIIKREKDLKALANKWKKERVLKEEEERKFIGFTKNSEIINGRMAMIFLLTGILTEYWTHQNIPTQIDTMFRIAGIF